MVEGLSSMSVPETVRPSEADYDISIMDELNRLGRYKVASTTYGYKLDFVAYSEPAEDVFHNTPEILLTKIPKWISEPQFDAAYINYILNQIKSWERSKKETVQSR